MIKCKNGMMLMYAMHMESFENLGCYKTEHGCHVYGPTMRFPQRRTVVGGGGHGSLQARLRGRTGSEEDDGWDGDVGHEKINLSL